MLRLKNHFGLLREKYRWGIWKTTEVMLNENTPWEWFEKHVFGENPIKVNWSIVANASSCTEKVLENILTSTDSRYDEFKGAILSDTLLSNEHVTLNFIKKYVPQFLQRLNFYIQNTTLEEVIAHPEIDWDYYQLLSNPNISIEQVDWIMQKYFTEDKIYNEEITYNLSQNPNMTWKYFKQYSESVDHENFWNISFDTFRNNLNFSYNDIMELIKLYSGSIDSPPVELLNLFENPNVTWEHVKNTNHYYDFESLIRNPSFTYDILMSKEFLMMTRGYLSGKYYNQDHDEVDHPEYDTPEDFIRKCSLANPSMTYELISQNIEMSIGTSMLQDCRGISANLFGRHPFLQKKYKEEGWSGAIHQGRQVVRDRFDKSVLLEMYTLLLCNQYMANTNNISLHPEIIHMIGEYVIYE